MIMKAPTITTAAKMSPVNAPSIQGLSDSAQ
jgi:hypothetical protein